MSETGWKQIRATPTSAIAGPFSIFRQLSLTHSPYSIFNMRVSLSHKHCLMDCLCCASLYALCKMLVMLDLGNQVLPVGNN